MADGIKDSIRHDHLSASRQKAPAVRTIRRAVRDNPDLQLAFIAASHA
ncbi:hypothetical protein [Acidovorax sp. JG5]|nr:hypothetical protein [Acidovorax sp. JG5]